jgi:hypothetical protein
MKYYSFSTKGYYTPEIHGENMPTDVIEMTDEVYNQVFEAQCNGYVIEKCSVNGIKAMPPPAKTSEELAVEIRFARDNLLLDLDSLVNNPLRWNAYSAEYKSALAEYRQNLLDIPNQNEFPVDVIFPSIPASP